MQSLIATALEAFRGGRKSQRSPAPRVKTRTIAIASGKGGAGKTSVAACLAWILAERGHSVCLVDVDLGLSNVDVLLGISPHYTLEDVILGDVAMEQAITTVRPGLDVISGGSGAAALADLGQAQRVAFLSKIKALDHYDYLLLDNAPGIHKQVVAFCLAAREQIIVINPEPTSVTDGYALLKVLRQNGMRRPPYILVNRVQEGFDHATLTQRFADVCKKHLQAVILPLGGIPDDPVFRQSAAKSVLPVITHPHTRGCLALGRVASLLVKRKNPEALFSNAHGFWSDSLVNLFQGLDLPASHDPAATQGQEDSLHDVLSRLERVVQDLEAVQVKMPGQASHASNGRITAEQLVRIGERLLAVAQHWKSGGKGEVLGEPGRGKSRRVQTPRRD